MKQEKWIIWFFCAALIIGAGIWYTNRSATKSSPVSFLEESEPAGYDKDALASPQQGDEDAIPNEVAVYICGAVTHPGVYRFSQNTRVCDVIEAAGGLTKKADSSAVNQARFVQDGEQIQIPTKKESSSASKQISETGAKEGTVSSDGKVNINTATREELMTLPGIGEAKADAIIAYREEHGLFQKPEDIMNISGIKNGVYQKISEKITI